MESETCAMTGLKTVAAWHSLRLEGDEYFEEYEVTKGGPNEDSASRRDRIIRR